MQAAAMPGPEARPPISGFPLAPGVRLGKFEILHELASGGMGKIYVAQDTLTNAVCALKVLIPAFDAEPARLDRFKRESLIGLRLNHRNIIRIHDIGEDAGFYFISMELLDGEDLRTLLDREPHPDLTRIAGLCLQMLDGLEFAHEQAVVHRDFKPQNIFLTTAGVVKLLDFGVAQALRIGSNTTAGCMIGTPGYMSPEQATGKSALDGRSDIYSWGVVLYEMLTGRLPFRGDNPLGVAAAHVYETPPPILTLKRDLAPALAALVMRCLEKNPDSRFADVSELRTAFKAALEEAGAAVEQVAAANRNARTPTPQSAVGVTLGQNAIITKIIPKRLREALDSDRTASKRAAERSLKRLIAVLGIGGAGALATVLWPRPYRCDAVQRIEVSDYHTVQASILSAGPSRMSRACKIQSEAALALVNSQLAEANAKVREALALEPKLVWANVMSGDLAAQDGNLDAARRAYEKATTARVGTAPERALAWARLARLALDKDELDGASRYLDEASRTGASIPEVHHLLAQLDAKRGDPSGAQDEYRKAIAMAPADGVAQALLDDLLSQQTSRADVEHQRWIAEMIQKIDERAKGLREGKAPPPIEWKGADRARVFAVLPLEPSGAASALRAGLGDALRISLERELAGLDKAKVVDREILDHVLSEQLLGASSLADRAAALQLGKILSVRYLVRPQLTRLDDTLVFNVRVIDVETTEIVASLSPEIPAGAKPAEIAANLIDEIGNRI